MRKYPDKKTIVLAAAAFALVLNLGIGSAMAYFTTYASASGAVEIELGLTVTTPEETVSDWVKHIRITNTGDYDCFVRVKLFAGAEYQELLTYSDASGKWSPGADGYYYYSDIVPAGGSTKELLAGIREIKDSMESTENPKDFNVIVVQECTMAVYDENGKPTADWSKIADSSTNSYGEQIGRAHV